jgi:mannose-6-phosphate isomerase
VELLDNPIRTYAWGSHVAIAAIQGRPYPTPQPEAELWMGAHPTGPSRLVVDGTPLDAAIAADPPGVLGVSIVDDYGIRLPYLMKILAASEPLSLQAHPDLVQARAGYARHDPNYTDPWHKPELLVAIDFFDALCGFRDPAESAALLGALGVPALKPTVDALAAAEPATALRDAVQGLLTLDESTRGPLVSAVAAACAARATEHPVYALAETLVARYPDDVGVIVAMLLNRVRLEPGQAVWMPAGNLHAYLSGVGIEIMAASDNVLRGGLTPKPVDVGELLRILRYEVLDDPVVRPVPVAAGLTTWSVPVRDFALYRARVDGNAVVVPGAGPRIVLCLRGSVRVDDGVFSITLHAGEAAFTPAGRPPLSVSGDGEAYQASVG